MKEGSLVTPKDIFFTMCNDMIMKPRMIEPGETAIVTEILPGFKLGSGREAVSMKLAEFTAEIPGRQGLFCFDCEYWDEVQPPEEGKDLLEQVNECFLVEPFQLA